MRMYFWFAFVLSLCCVQQIYCQKNNFNEEIRFLNHLLSRGNYNEALFLLQEIQTDDPGKQDSIHYYSGWILYSQKDLEASASFLSQVGEQNPFFLKSRFFASYNMSYLAQYDMALQLLDLPEGYKEGIFLAMINFQTAGIALLERRFDDFQSFSKSFEGNFSILAQEEERLQNYFSDLSNRSNRSPFIAALLSTAVPGLGKMYAGKPAEAIAGFLYVGAMGAVTYDFFNRKGLSNPFFIISAGITSIFYIGNIWGSAVAVNRTKNEFNYEINQRILFDMHIPLRNLFP